MTKYARQIANAKRLIAAKGGVFDYVRVNAPDAPIKVSVVLLPNEKENAMLVRMLTGSDVQSGNQIGLMGAVAFEPNAAGDMLNVGSVSYRVLDANPVQPDGVPIIWTLNLAG